MITDLAQFLKFLYSDDGPLTKLARKSPGEPFTVGEEAMVRAVMAGICGLELFHAIEKAYASDDDDAPTAILDVVRNRLGLPLELGGSAPPVVREVRLCV